MDLNGRSYSVFSKEERTRIAVAEPEPVTNGKRTTGVHRCPRCRWSWIEGAPESRLTWPGLALEHLNDLKIVLDRDLPTVRAVMRASISEGAVGRVAERLNVSRRALYRRLRAAALPPASRWVQLTAALGVGELMLTRGMTLFDAAEWLGGDQFHLSNLMQKRLGVRPAGLGELPDPVWQGIVDRWLDRWEEDA